MASTKKTIHEVIVMGGGLMGSAAAWHLSNYNKEVLLLEKQGEIYHSGSSKGEARIVRSTNIENDKLWSYLHNCSVTEVQILIGFLNEQGIDITIEDIYTTSPISYLARLEELDQLLDNLKTQEVNFELATTADEGKSKFGVNLRNGIFLQREYNRYSGTLNPLKLIQSLHKAIILKGNKIWHNTEIKEIERKDGLYVLSVLSSDGLGKILFAKQVVCATGPYTGRLLKKITLYFDRQIIPKRVFLGFLKIKDEHYANLTPEQKLKLKNGFPIIDRSIDIQTEEFFAMIEKHNAHGNPILKAGGHYHRSEISNPDDVWKAKLSADEINWSIEKIVNYLNFLNLPIEANHIEVVDEYSCIYSLTETEVPYVTPILNADNSKDENSIVIAGMSGVGAKGAMAYGLIAANLLTNKKQEDSFYETAVAKLGYERLGTKTL